LKYNTDIWNEYTQENESSFQKSLSNFIYDTSLVLGAKKVLEAGCNVGNNLRSFPSDSNVFGLDMNEKALIKAKSQLPNFNFKQGTLTKIPFEDNYFDLVFTRGVLIHIHPDEMNDVMKEILRVSKKWIFNLEYFGEDNKMIKWKRGDELLWYRDMTKRWREFDVNVLSSITIPEEIDSGKTHLTLVIKNLQQ
jgi:SAM-dependent methyltransferase